MTMLQRLVRAHKDICKLGLPSETTRRALIKLTGEKPGKDWLKRVSKRALR